MRIRIIPIILLVGLLPLTAMAQEDKAKNSGTLSIYLENDYFFGTDRDYTSGIKLAWISPDISNYRKKPLLKWLPFVNKPGYQHAVSISLGQNIYTPDDIKRSDLIIDDRPYAGMLYLEIGVHSKNNNRMETFALDLGIIGPHSYAEDTQKLVHRWISTVRPKGWHNQLKDEPVLEIIYERKWKFLWTGVEGGFGLDLIPHLGGGLGNIYTYASTGMLLRLGWNLPGDFGTNLIRPGGESNVGFSERDSYSHRCHKYGINVFLGLEGQAVLRNIFLDGNTFKDSHRVDKIPLTANIRAGLYAKAGPFIVSYAYVFWTKQFKTQRKNQVFGAINLSFSY